MKTSPRAPRRALTRLALALFFALTVCLGAAAAAPAAPPEPTLTVAQLQALLDASPGGTVEGYFKTVLKGSDIVAIPVTVRSTVPYSIPEGSLILFQAKGPAIEEIGGIAQGMSGSPLYVVGQGGDKLVGAVSYGDIFTRGYLGLATPVEYMAAMEDTFLPNPVPIALPRPLKIDGVTLSHVVVARSGREARAFPKAAGTAVMAPLATVGIFGLPPQSAAYKHLAAAFEKRGCDVAPYGTSRFRVGAHVRHPAGRRRRRRCVSVPRRRALGRAGHGHVERRRPGGHVGPSLLRRRRRGALHDQRRRERCVVEQLHPLQAHDAG